MRYIAVEFRKILATRFALIMALCSFVFASLLTALVWFSLTSIAKQPEGTSLPQPSLTEAYGMPGQYVYILALLSGVVIVTTEFRHRTLSRTLQTGVSRGFLVFAKMCATTLFSLILGAGTALCGGVVFALVVNASGKRDPELFGEASLTALGLTALVFAGWGLIGIGAGLLLRNQVAAITSMLAFALIIEPLITLVLFISTGSDRASKFLPSRLMLSALNHEKFNAEPLVIGWQYSLLIMLAIGIVLILIGFFVNFRRRSIS